MTGLEGRGKNNALSGGMYHGLTFWAPNETPGEDPMINSDYAEQYVSGLQGDDDKYLKVSSCLKHYAAYSQETGRNSFPAVVSSQDMEDTYLPAFEAGVTKGKASSIMCSKGIFGAGTQGGAIPSCANKGILNDLARAKWGFDGYITSDCGAVSNDTVNAVMQAGMDTDCGGFMKSQTMLGMMQDKKISMGLIDGALTHLFRVQFRQAPAPL
eukprot:gene28571-54499_t